MSRNRWLPPEDVKMLNDTAALLVEILEERDLFDGQILFNSFVLESMLSSNPEVADVQRRIFYTKYDKCIYLKRGSGALSLRKVAEAFRGNQSGLIGIDYCTEYFGFGLKANSTEAAKAKQLMDRVGGMVPIRSNTYLKKAKKLRFNGVKMAEIAKKVADGSMLHSIPEARIHADENGVDVGISSKEVVPKADQNHPTRQQGLLNEPLYFLAEKFVTSEDDIAFSRLVPDDMLNEKPSVREVQERLFVTKDLKCVYIKSDCRMTSEVQIKEGFSMAPGQLAKEMKLIGLSL
ncbi:MAG: hypothetical protein M1831_005773 [Alyxoria varia]|nr:MAG: hypothetical protein M1831_005773 [Alyxoria varia]